MTKELEHTRTVAPGLPSHLRRPRLRRREASEYLGIAHGVSFSVATLAKMASVGGGPRYQKSGRVPLYPIEELDRWAIDRLGGLMRNSSDYSGAKARPQTGIDPTPICGGAALERR